MMLSSTGAGASVECSTSTTGKRRDVIARVFWTERVQRPGIYRRSLLLASGRFAMLDDGLGFSLVPWRPVIERRLGQTVSAVVRGEHVTWGLGRGRSLLVA